MQRPIRNAASATLGVTVIALVSGSTLLARNLQDPPKPVPNAECPEDVPAQELGDTPVFGCGADRAQAIQVAIAGSSSVVCDLCPDGKPCPSEITWRGSYSESVRFSIEIGGSSIYCTFGTATGSLDHDCAACP